MPDDIYEDDEGYDDDDGGWDRDDLGEPSRVRKSPDHHHLLNVFRDLALYTDPNRLDEVAAAITGRLTEPWRRAAEHDESDLNRGLTEWRVFERLADRDRPGALLFLVPNRTENRLYVSNIVPTKGHSLGVENYNEILVEFTNRFARPVADERAIRCELTSDWADFGGDLGETAFEALVAASIFPSGTHPSDRERWMRFILTAREQALDVDLVLLARWLEAEGFTPRRASSLVDEYDFALKLLDVYDQT